MVIRPFLPALLLGLLPAPALAAGQAAAITPPTAPQAPSPDTLVLEGDNIITLIVNGTALRFEVSAEAFGAPVVNPEVAAAGNWLPEARRGWRFGPVALEGHGAVQAVDFGAGPVPLLLTWSARPVSSRADGVIGVHHLPYTRVTFRLGARAEGAQTYRFALVRAGGARNTRIGTEVLLGKERLLAIFVPDRAHTLVTAPTANFLATHLDGGFEPGAPGVVAMPFGITRPMRMMRTARPLEIGPFAITQFAVRIADYGTTRRVGELAADDPRLDPSQILVSRRKGRGRPDLLTRIGRDQLGACAAITYDFALAEIRLTCADGAA
ncbi:MAG: hypothetical protein KatS3mg120_1094 [Erythrobacter sp.]|nr:MAG: hypothetical protein KatS3mg120_1094 [Erythrobacter sp.]